MIIPLQISFRNMKPSEAVENRVREEVSKLETFYQGIMRCRVEVGLPHKHHRKGDLFHVRIDLTAPGVELVVKKEPSLQASLRRGDAAKHAKSHEPNAAHKDVFVVIRDAFKEARRQLQDYARRLRGQTKTHVLKPSARVSQIFPEEGYGFLETADGNEIYFDKNSVVNDAFNRLAIGNKVTFSEELGEKGVQASTIRPSDKTSLP
ncbi:MAG TPA: HPF/RaiA family ribosome-associated protein [Pyrinomonadaceae bacterium]|jgi:cold shock CspA family protein|nr:HPF/RaiA family ribosome-associated protein [Pyrinomonadaceae bacterium]